MVDGLQLHSTLEQSKVQNTYIASHTPTQARSVCCWGLNHL